ncbi:CU044_2847 family protein [Streptomyces sp. NBC_00893]|uniref:CU044_2847 family protein n=1 Tax=Streptomyces sp. NBC_00893 TaxID=2975862 RepID=UPI002258FFC8|nr:CU044_2847 family protein [Streptomyces sp. NBC_00893]MCX4851396.1 CU044_2847 family protein [Streptomyces sp. NBC_00893]MCX4851819.1 CU044_2847 family protein [Streptomyces sp. NBC_00893]
MTGSQEFRLDDATTVRFLVAEERQPALEDEDSPDVIGALVPVARRGQAVADIAADVLRSTLKPLGPMIHEVHDAVTAGPTPPAEVTVTFGVQLGQDLKLGIVNGNGQAHLTVTATWKPET